MNYIRRILNPDRYWIKGIVWGLFLFIIQGSIIIIPGLLGLYLFPPSFILLVIYGRFLMSLSVFHLDLVSKNMLLDTPNVSGVIFLVILHVFVGAIMGAILDISRYGRVSILKEVSRKDRNILFVVIYCTAALCALIALMV